MYQADPVRWPRRQTSEQVATVTPIMIQILVLKGWNEKMLKV
jgi:hypothetical protein